MKKNFKQILIVIGIVIGLILIDSVQSLLFDNNPFISIEENYIDGNISYKSKGILVDTITCINGKKDTIIKGFSYSCDEEVKNYILVDETKNMNDFMCSQMLESFYEDEEYIYYWNCIKNDYMIIKYEDGTKETICDALNDKRIGIHVLDKFDIDYIKLEKEDID